MIYGHEIGCGPHLLRRRSMMRARYGFLCLVMALLAVTDARAQSDEDPSAAATIPAGQKLNISKPTAGFGEWVDLKPEVPYFAPWDGFVAAYTSGKGSNGGADLLSWPNGSDPKVQTRIGTGFDGALMPVRSGELFMVRRYKGATKGNLTVRYMPIP
jgi:hypothetical protein